MSWLKKNIDRILIVLLITVLTGLAIVTTRVASVSKLRQESGERLGITTEASIETSVEETGPIESVASVDKVIFSPEQEDEVVTYVTDPSTGSSSSILVGSDHKVSSGSETQDKYSTDPEASGSGIRDKDKDHKPSPSTGGQDKYHTDPTPEGKPVPINLEDQLVDRGESFTVTISIDCLTILDNMENLTPGLEKWVGNGTILQKTSVTCYKGENAYDITARICAAKGIQFEASTDNIYGSAYVESINNLAEFDCGELSGWTYFVNGWAPNYGCSRYVLKAGDNIQWRYTCNLGIDTGAYIP